MLAGVGPLLGDGVCGYFVSNTEKVPISYKDGAAMHGRYVRCRSNKNYRTKSEGTRIAVLMGKSTSSAGEIVALAFKGKEHVSFYGAPTAGLTTANSTYMLSDKSMLVLTVCLEADRTGLVCEGRLVPDEYVDNDDTAKRDKVIARARMWLDLP
jgi:carboxyl-terminal processing protease